jgi:hypothetical protein
MVTMKSGRATPAPLIVAVLMTAFGTGQGVMAQEVENGDDAAALSAEIERIRAATEAFHEVTAAHAAGYPTMVPGCLENPPQGGMGHHYIHPELMDDELEVERPEILVYAPTDEGGLKLAGVEYAVPYTAWPRDGREAPRILGRDLKPSDPLQLWYLHVWVWEENSKGLFADWNPAVRCSR